MGDRKRDATIDIARGIAMILVVFGHSAEIFFSPAMRTDGAFDNNAFEVWRMIYSFHMPAFYFISGTTAVAMREHNVVGILKSSAALVFFAGATHLLTLPGVIALDAHLGIAKYGGSFVRAAFWPVISMNNYCNVLTWFLASLAIVRLYAYFVLKGRAPFKIIAILFAGIAALFGSYFNTGILQIPNIFYGLIFFLSGLAFANNYGVIAKYAGQRAALVVALMLALLLLTYSRNYGSPADPFIRVTYDKLPKFAVVMAVGRVGFIPLFFVSAYCGTLSVVFAAKLLGSQKWVGYIEYIGKNTIELVMINGAVFVLVEPVLARTIDVRPDGWVVWSLAITMLQFAIVPLVGPAINWLYRQCQKAGEIAATYATVAFARIFPRPALK